MEVVVNDTNILIDLHSADLLNFCKPLSLDFHTLDLVIAEIEDESQFQGVQKLIDDGVLKVKSLSGMQMVAVMDNIEKYKGVCNLSVVDISVMEYAKENRYRLLTGDKVLRAKAEAEAITVSGILFLTDKMVEEGIVAPFAMAECLERLMEGNKRLPNAIIRKRIAELRGETQSE